MKKRVFMILTALSMLSVVTPVLAAPAIKIPVSGSFLGSATNPRARNMNNNNML